MTSLLQQIHEDHIHIARLMDILDEQVSLFQSGEVSDYNLMLDIMHYMMNYPDIVHHGIEDIIFQRLVELNPKFADQAEEMARQHADLIEKAKDFSDDLQSIVDGDGILVRDQIEQKARYYISLMREHMNQEEGELLPAAEQELTKQDFKTIKRSVPEIVDPMKNKTLLREYETLYKHIVDED